MPVTTFTPPYDIVCFSHLRWDWVYQRPQHLLERLARQGHRVFFIEEPLTPDEGDARRGAHWTFSEPAPNVLRCVPRFTAAWPLFLDEGSADTWAMRRLLSHLHDVAKPRDPVVWVYAPLAVPVLSVFPARAIVYDCMDELANFAGAPPEMLAREEQIMQLADLVFTGGRSMYEAREGRHPNLHLFPSSVDAAHFAGALHPDTPLPADLPSREGHPVLGFYGVLDERLDLPLIDAAAALRPDWQFVFVGPVAKISRKALPQHPNVHYLGQRPYEQLPHYLKGWDVCLMPFARNEATRYISPTKTLEYLAAEKPIVSTSIPDVVRHYQGVVRFADTPGDFVAAIDAALREEGVAAEQRRAGGRAILDATSWDATAAQMRSLIDAVLLAGGEERQRANELVAD